MTKRNQIIYWASTILLSLGMFSGGLAQVFRAKQTVEGITHLGYTVYFCSIIGTWKILGVIAILIPKFPLLKEWAYAGLFFAMSGATISHIASGDDYSKFMAPLVFAILTILSWYFRPVNRKLMAVNP